MDDKRLEELKKKYPELVVYDEKQGREVYVGDSLVWSDACDCYVKRSDWLNLTEETLKKRYRDKSLPASATKPTVELPTISLDNKFKTTYVFPDGETWELDKINRKIINVSKGKVVVEY